MQLSMALKPHRKLFSRITAGCLLIMCALPSHAFEELTDVQTLIYDTGHLSNTIEGDVIKYHYKAINPGEDNIVDTASLNIIKALPEGRRDVELNFLTDSRNLPLPPFSGYRGNPVVIAMLEHVAQSMATATGGGTLYFRNRIRDALANKELAVESGKDQYDQKEIVTSNVSFSPFIDDTYLEASSIFRHALFSFKFSDSAPAGVLRISVTAQADDQQFNRILSLE
ncbi:hypothetical protein [Granulosicoccus antarcticus]|uniref:Uncharacterized protein n=1 Tax=Granulosicoccus antarcticus IMCC3135 TaxID=1192854 RepID=A0A2Z2NK11_9GAMM|nr:hypothetical protein [Granulosicoccus antarcticus]ASJ70218.1 hypothetical protein IMCC3135_00460 [Granulosicoccus antarcticus IMCC3135]